MSLHWPWPLGDQDFDLTVSCMVSWFSQALVGSCLGEADRRLKVLAPEAICFV